MVGDRSPGCYVAAMVTDLTIPATPNTGDMIEYRPTVGPGLFAQQDIPKGTRIEIAIPFLIMFADTIESQVLELGYEVPQ